MTSTVTRIHLFFLLLLVPALTPTFVSAQCVGIPPITSLGSNKFPEGLCAPVQANVTYSVAFAASVPGGKLELVYDWGDGTPSEVVPLSTGVKSYNESRSHEYPADSDCEYFVTMVVRYNGKVCTNTTQVQRISSWRTDAFNGGDVSLISPTTKTDVHLVCEGEDISVIFNDNTNWNCNNQSLFAGPDPIESPNTEYRWQQIVYNTSITGNKIPNVSVDGVSITGPDGSDLIAGYQDPRGVFFMSAPVLLNDARRRPTLTISAPGGFGAQYPKAGDEFAVTLRYWNFCNPYDDPEVPGPPSDLVNGDHAPVEKRAIIRVVAPPPALKAVEQAVCFANTPSAFSATGVTEGNVVNWYRYVPGTQEAGALIASGTSASLPITSHPDWKNNKTPGVYSVWVSQQTNTAGATNCESPPTLVTRIIRENLLVPDPLDAPPAEICNAQSFTVVLPAPATEYVGGRTQYVWTGASGVSLESATAASATFSVNVADFGGALYVDRVIKVNRQFADNPACGKARTFAVRVYREPSGGTLGERLQFCEEDSVGLIALTGYTGVISHWEVKNNGGAFLPYSDKSDGNSIAPGYLTPGVWTFRAVVENGPCKEVFSNEQIVEISAKPSGAYAGDDQFICSALQSAALNANIPESGKGVWTYVNSLPAGLPAPVFDASDPNTTVVISAENAGVYTLRWTVTNGSCASFDEVVIDFGTNPTDPLAGPDRSICGTSTALEGNIPEKGLGSWTVVSGPDGCAGNACGITVVTPTSPTARVELSGSSPRYGTYTLRWSVSSGGNNCFLKWDDVTLTFHEPVSVAASDINDLCLERENPEPIALTGTVTGPASSSAWEVAEGQGTVSELSTTEEDGSLRVNALYYPVAADYVNGQPLKMRLVATPMAGTCSAVEKIVAINFERVPIADAGSDVEQLCENAVTLNAATPDFGATGRWTTAEPGVTFDNPANPKTIVRNLPEGKTQLTWTLTSVGGTCTSVPASIIVTRVPLPEVSNVEISECEIQSGQTNVILSSYEDRVTSLSPETREIMWYKGATATAGSAIADPTVPFMGVADGQTFVARVRDIRSACSSDAIVTIKVRPLPVVINAVVSRCEDVQGGNTVSGIDLYHSDFTLGITKQSDVEVAWFYTEGDALADQLQIVGPVTVNGQHAFYARVTYRDSPYCYSIARLDLVVNAQPSIRNIVGKESVCQSVSSSLGDLPVHVYQVAPIPGARYHWEIPDDPSSQFRVFGGGRESDFYVLLQFPNAYTGKIRVSAETNGCTGPYIEKEVAVSPSPAKPIIQGTSIVCENAAGVAFSVSPNNFPASAYNWEIRRASDNTLGGAYISEGQLTGNVLITFAEESVIVSVRESNAECVSPVATRVVTVTDPPKANLFVEKEISCFMEDDGAIRAEVVGGMGPYSDFTLFPGGQKDADDNGVFEELSQGSYSIRVKDANGCYATSNAQILTQPGQVTIDGVDVLTDASGYNVSCREAQDGAISVSFSGGSASDLYTVSLLGYNSPKAPLVLKGREQVTISDLPAGTYSLQVEDVNGCASIPSVAFLVAPPSLYAGVIGSDQVICSGDDPSELRELAAPRGGTKSYSYEWQESLTGDVYNDAEWNAIPGANGPSWNPPVLTTTNPLGEQHHYRRIVRSISTFTGRPQACEVAGKTEKVTITVNPIPLVDFRAASSDVCAGDALALTLSLTRGRAPVEFDFASTSQTFLAQHGPVQTTITVADVQSDNTYSLLRLRDANGCLAEEMPPPVEVRVMKVNPSFTVARPEDECDGGAFVFNWEVEAGVDYRWEWGDGTITEFKNGAIAPGLSRQAHTFRALSAGKASEYRVNLFASRPGCVEKVATQSVSVAPAIHLNILSGDTLLCSGEEITFYNNSTGVDKGEWYSLPSGTAERMQPIASSGGDISFRFENTTSSNPLRYQVMYEASNNSGCTAVYSQDVLVYRANQAAFEVTSTPAFETESVQVGINHTSEVLDVSQFVYTWTYGEQGFSKGAGDASRFDITYLSPGTKEISLHVVNAAAQAAGKVCQSLFRKQITIPVSEVKARFAATPFASCSPVSIKGDNKSTGADTYHWELSRSGTVISTSNLRYPEFRINEPGLYDLKLIVSVSATGQSDEVLVKGLRVLEAPSASFELRSNLVYVPDVPMESLNFSMGGSQYEWRFGDGDTSDAFEPTHVFSEEGRYTVELVAGIDHGMIDADGDGLAEQRVVCYDTARREVVAMPGGELNIPNAFTPDTSGPGRGHTAAGGFNDVFLPMGKGLTDFRMQIFDRWGTLVYESNDKDIGWDGYDRHGRLLPAGVYVYKLTVRTSSGENVSRAGDVTLLR